MGNKPWLPAEIDLLRQLAGEGRNDVEIAAEIDKWWPRRTPTSCWYQARLLGFEIEWTTRPAAVTPDGRLRLRPGKRRAGRQCLARRAGHQRCVRRSHGPRRPCAASPFD
jgi:hypothetical protein